MNTQSCQPKAALVLFSGGQDSTVCLAWALKTYHKVETIGFHYGQRHSVELECRQRLFKEIAAAFPAWAEKLGPDHMVDLSVLGTISETALTSEAEIGMAENGLPNTFVPGRNLLFFTLAAAVGFRRNLFDLVGGMCQTDYSGYPDCRNATLAALQETINLGTNAQFSLRLPLMWRSKAETWAIADELGGLSFVNIVAEYTHTCYKGERTERHPWGYGCGNCPACVLRASGYGEWINRSKGLSLDSR